MAGSCSRVSLKAQLGLPDIEQLINDVRKRVEYQDASAEQTVKSVLIPSLCAVFLLDPFSSFIRHLQ